MFSTTFKKVPLVGGGRRQYGRRVTHDGPEYGLQGRPAVLVVDVEAGEVAGLGSAPVAVGKGALFKKKSNIELIFFYVKLLFVVC